MQFKRDEAGRDVSAGIRGEWQVHPWEDNRRGDRFALLLFREGLKPRPFGIFISSPDAQAAAEKYDERGN